MNPTGERPYGIVSAEETGHLDIYLKRDNGNPDDSRFLTIGTRVEFDNLWPAFLVTFKNKVEILDDWEGAIFEKGRLEKGIKNIERYKKAMDELKELLNKSDFELITLNWESSPGEIPLVVDFTNDLRKHKDADNEDVNKEMRDRAYNILID
jgi:hypothetical protein